MIIAVSLLKFGENEANLPPFIIGGGGGGGGPPKTDGQDIVINKENMELEEFTYQVVVVVAGGRNLAI